MEQQRVIKRWEERSKMKVEQQVWAESIGWKQTSEKRLELPPQLVLVFGSRELMGNEDLVQKIRADYPDSHILMNSTAGEICDTYVMDNSLVVNGIHFEKTQLKTAVVNISDFKNSRLAGEQLAKELDIDGLAHVFVISDGLKVNGSELVIGLHTHIPEHIPVTGGLAGDGSLFEKTLVGLDTLPQEGNIVVLGLYGDLLRVGHGSVGGWDAFGPKRIITKADSNVLYELDGQSALGLYKRYLGEEAAGLPSTGLLFPLAVTIEGRPEPVVRTILAVDENKSSMTFAGDIPVGSKVQLMKANFDRLVDGAEESARHSFQSIQSDQPELVLCISCVGRKLILGQRIDDEIEVVRDIMGDDAVISGFYSYGEISPLKVSTRCELHNQTMTITALTEV